MKKLSVVSCTRGRKEETDLYHSLRKLGTSCFVFIENNRNGLSTCYNRILDERAGRDEIVIFVHDDVTIGDLFLREKITTAFDERTTQSQAWLEPRTSGSLLALGQYPGCSRPLKPGPALWNII